MEHTEIQNVSGTYYVRGQVSGETISPPYVDRGEALAKAGEIEALPAEERKLVLAGRQPAPGCTWLVGAGREIRSGS